MFIRPRRDVPLRRRAVLCVTAMCGFALPAIGSADAESDWQARANAPGVVLATSFESAADRDRKYIHPDGGAANATFENDQAASGSYSLRFRIPSNSGEGASGSYKRNFGESPANDVQFGSGDEFYVQWRQRFSKDMHDTVYRATDWPGGWKQIIIGEGDQPGWNYGDASEASSCSTLEIVMQNVAQRHFPIMYHSCARYTPFEEGFSSQYNANDFKQQNAIDGGSGSDKERFVLYSQEQENVNAVRPDFPGVSYHPDEWMTFMVRVALGPLGTARDSASGQSQTGFTSSTVETWAAREGELLIKTHSFDNLVLSRAAGASPSGDFYGKVWLLPFHTAKDASQSHPVGYTWYDELIVSTQRIADPAGGPAPPPPPPDPEPEPAVSLMADPMTVSGNETSTLSWSSTDADSCVASGDWAGTRPTEGSEEVGPLAADSTFTLDCTGPGGSAAASVTVSTPAGDTTPPAIETVTASDGARVTVAFTEAVDRTSAETAGNYAIGNGIAVQSAILEAADAVVLSTSTLQQNVEYVLTVRDVFDRAATPNPIAPDTEFAFRFEGGLIGADLTPHYYERDFLGEGRRSYVDQFWSFTGFPVKYTGFDFLRTADGDKFGSGDPFVSFNVTRDVIVYVAYDLRNSTLPGWLDESWWNTGDEINTGAGVGEPDARLRLYSKDFPAGVVELGGNEMGNSMYTVLVESGSSGGGGSGGGGSGGGGPGGGGTAGGDDTDEPASSQSSGAGAAGSSLCLLLLLTARRCFVAISADSYRLS